MSEPLRVAVCLFPGVTGLDYQGSMELFNFLSPSALIAPRRLPLIPAFSLDVTYLSHTLDAVTLSSGMRVLAAKTYADAKDEQFDVIFVPGGPPTHVAPDVVPPVLLEFIKLQAPKAKYILSVCTGSWLLAGAGLLEGKRATTNKAAFKVVKDATSKKIEWVEKARWVVDGNIWTSSGVTAGMDMGSAFLTHLVGKEVADVIRDIVELSPRGQDDDEFAAVHGLI